MKYFKLIFILLLFSGQQLKAQDTSVKTETFKVYGNCGMCKKTIEKAANGVSGVQSADWDKETDIITVSFNAATADVVTIKKAIAASGYDTEEFRAPEEAYNNLPGCCQYDRPAAKASTASMGLTNEKVTIFRVYGNCGMCKRRIEGAVKDGKSVSDALWDSETGNVTIKYDPTLVTEEQLMQKISAVGHDTDKFRAKGQVYENLPGCCLYERPKS